MTLTPEQEAEKQRLEAIREAPCPKSPTKSPHAQHADPDNSGQCIYCTCALDIIEGLDY